jgi:hypothetical protein
MFYQIYSLSKVFGFGEFLCFKKTIGKLKKNFIRIQEESKDDNQRMLSSVLLH